MIEKNKNLHRNLKFLSQDIDILISKYLYGHKRNYKTIPKTHYEDDLIIVEIENWSQSWKKFPAAIWVKYEQGTQKSLEKSTFF